ncbi:MAG: DUF1460 domain-containing protein [Prevotella sp.]|nr:DUF1460 domain-containing protein [Prevotella sp.]
MKHRLLILLLALFPAIAIWGQRAVTYSKADSIAIERLLAGGATSVLHYARQFVDVPYVAHTLEVNDDERLVVNTRQLDCTTLVEMATALALCARQHRKSFGDYCQVLQQLRYRQGRINGYPSRLHYFTDWIEDNAQMGIVTEVQQRQSPFTAVQQISLNFMSQHPSSYKALKAHPELVKDIAAQERALTGKRYRYIPKKNVRNTAELRSAVKDGDIIAITCNKKGLDIAHLGFAVWRKDGLHLLNASQIHKKVVEEPMTLGEYLSKHPSHTGIRIIRINTK